MVGLQGLSDVAANRENIESRLFSGLSMRMALYDVSDAKFPLLKLRCSQVPRSGTTSFCRCTLGILRATGTPGSAINNPGPEVRDAYRFRQVARQCLALRDRLASPYLEVDIR